MFKKIKKKKNNRRSLPSPVDTHRRIMILGVLLIAGFVVVVGKLFWVQVVDHGYYQKVARRYLEHRRELLAQRGSILDRNRQILAVDLIHYSLAIRPRLVADRAKAARQIASLISVPYRTILKKIQGNKSFVYIAHRLSVKTAEKLRALGIKGVVLEKKFSRYYPYKEQAAQTIGYCDYENEAKSGLELEYDHLLRGKPGWTIFLRDALGNQFPNLDFPTSQPVNGMNLETTLDMVYQSILEEELSTAVQNHRAESGSAVLMDPRTGEVLAMANAPGFDPNRYNLYPLENYRNRAVTDSYEPGSTFKMVALAVSIEHQNLDLNKKLVYCENGRYRLGKKTIEDHHPYGYLTVRQAFERSSNIGIIKLSNQFPAPIFYRYARDFGFGAKTGIDLPAEESGILHKPGEYSRYSLAYMSIGYEVSVTPLQLAAAYGAIANDGLLMQPFVVRRIVDNRGRTYQERKPQKIRQVVSPATAKRMKEVLVGVVENGTGHTAYLKGVTIAGKTGTAQKLDPRTGSYTSDKHVAYFVGFFPAESPRFVLAVVINTPRKGYYGSQVAAPAFRNIARRIIGLPGDSETPEYRVARAQIELPGKHDYLVPLEGLSVKAARKILKRRGIACTVIGDGDVVYRQEPAAYSEVTSNTKVKLYTENGERQEPALMPRLTGLTLKEALQVMAAWDVSVEVEGSGVVVKQQPGAGKKISERVKVKLVCKPA